MAMGGTLHQRVHEVSGLDDHREDKEQPLEVQYGPAHDVVLEPGSVLRGLVGTGARARELAALAGRGPARARISRSRRAPPTGWSRPFAWRRRRRSRSRCNGTPSGR